jgi:hypothetical protein
MELNRFGRAIVYSTIVCATTRTYPSPVSLPSNINSQIPIGYNILTVQAADINKDKLIDYVIVIHKRDEAEISQRLGKAPRRPLLVFTQEPDKTFSLSARNDNVVYAIDEGGQCDPFMDSGNGIAIKGTYFTVENGVACGAHWTDYITFKFSGSLKNFIFHKRSYENWILNNSGDPNADALVLEKRKVTTGKRNAPILLKDYKPD